MPPVHKTRISSSKSSPPVPAVAQYIVDVAAALKRQQRGNTTLEADILAVLLCIMESRVDGHVFPQNEFDIPLGLAANASPQAVPEYAENGGYYQGSPTVVQPLFQSEKTNDADEIDGASGVGEPSLKPANSAVQTNLRKPKRVRTGCLTCRERHLKCDEAVPRCQNCQKSDRLCKRGVRLNFIDTQVAAPPYLVSPTQDWTVNFHDESRDIASEYVGGYERYPSTKKGIPGTESSALYDIYDPGNQDLSTGVSLLSAFPDQTQVEMTGQIFQTNPTPVSTFSNSPLQNFPFESSKTAFISSNTPRPYLNTGEEVLLMQVFAEEVGVWMDSMDATKHFTNILPFHALSEPMLLHAFMACGARHLFLVNPSFGEEKALYYYNVSTRDLLNCLQNPNRDTALCATTAVVLNVYEIMCEKPMQRMNHIAGARALIKECRWNAKSTGIGGACFWLNVGMELLSCFHFNWKMAWDPDAWDVDMNMGMSLGNVAGDEELWTHRIVYICAKIADFRSTISKFQRLGRVAYETQLGQRCDEWNNLKAWCDEWTRCIPRSMQPLGYLQTWQTNSKSSFPEVWLIKRSAIVGRLFYHTGCCLLAQSHPLESEFNEEMHAMQQSHARDICGIVAHVKDRGVASVSLRCLAIAAECLVDRQSQEEVIQILDRIIKETGWQATFLQHELVEKWGWNSAPTQASHPGQTIPPVTTASSPELGSTLLNSGLPSPQARPQLLQGIVNPLMATADFSSEDHPYRNYYVAPQNSHLSNYHFESY